MVLKDQKLKSADSTAARLSAGYNFRSYDIALYYWLIHLLKQCGSTNECKRFNKFFLASRSAAWEKQIFSVNKNLNFINIFLTIRSDFEHDKECLYWCPYGATLKL